MLDFLAFPSGWLLKAYYKLSNPHLRCLGLDVLRISECLDLEMFFAKLFAVCVIAVLFLLHLGAGGCVYCVLLAV